MMDHGVQELQELTGTRHVDRDVLTATYRNQYTRGWLASKASATVGELNGGPSALERADARGEPDAWYHGYEDYACGLRKWTALRDKGLF